MKKRIAKKILNRLGFVDGRDDLYWGATPADGARPMTHAEQRAASLAMTFDAIADAYSAGFRRGRACREKNERRKRRARARGDRLARKLYRLRVMYTRPGVYRLGPSSDALTARGPFADAETRLVGYGPSFFSGAAGSALRVANIIGELEGLAFADAEIAVRASEAMPRCDLPIPEEDQKEWIDALASQPRRADLKAAHALAELATADVEP